MSTSGDARGWWFEVWDLPEITTGQPTEQRRVPYLPIKPPARLREVFSTVGEGQLRIDSSYPYFDQILDPDNNVVSMLKLFVYGQEVMQFFPIRLSEPVDDDPGSTRTLTVAAIEEATHWGGLKTFDHPTFPSEQPDWSFGGGTNLISDNGFESGDSASPLVNGDAEDGTVAPWVPRGGATVENIQDALNEYEGARYFRITPTGVHSGMEQTVTVPPNSRWIATARINESTAAGCRYTLAVTMASDGTVHQGTYFASDGYVIGELDGVAYNGGCPGGASDGTYQLATVEITTGANQTSAKIILQYDHHGFCTSCGGPKQFWADAVTFDQVGSTANKWFPVNGGTIAIESVDPRSGSNHLTITSGASSEGGGTRVDGLTSGLTYSFWVYIKGTGTLQSWAIAARTLDNVQIGSVTKAVQSSFGYVLGLFTIVIPDGVESVNLLVQNLTGAGSCYIDDWGVMAGNGPASPGEQLVTLMNHIWGEGYLQWLALDFDADTPFDQDSDGVAWVDPYLTTVYPVGYELWHVLGLLNRWGYEWEIEKLPFIPADPPT